MDFGSTIHSPNQISVLNPGPKMRAFLKQMKLGKEIADYLIL